jgi:hypothetical protein
MSKEMPTLVISRWARLMDLYRHQVSNPQLRSVSVPPLAKKSSRQSYGVRRPRALELPELTASEKTVL